MINATIQKTHVRADRLVLTDPEYVSWVRRFTVGELKNDLYPNGDITTDLIFPEDERAEGIILAKQTGILSGIEELEYFFGKNSIQFVTHKKEGDLTKGSQNNPEKIFTVSGSLKTLLKVERVALNLLGRMSGIASLMNEYVTLAHTSNPDVLVTPTRKTLWGWLDKKACLTGGGGTHRLNLSDAILIKDNHKIAYGKTIKELLEFIFPKNTKEAKFIEIEVNSGKDALRAAEIFSTAKKKGISLPCFIMFDNVSVQEIQKTLAKYKSTDVFFEASGGITLENIAEYAKTGVSILSVGALTHSAPNLDVSLKLNSPSSANARGK